MKKVAILGATGAVGQEMVKILEERGFPVGTLRLLASEKSTGKQIPFRGELLPVELAAPESFRGCDLVLGAAEAEIARRFVGDIQKAGAVFVDNSSAFRLDSRVPLVVPEVNPEDVRHHLGILANPNCTTAITLTALAPLHRRSPVQSLVVSTYQAVSGAGSGGIDEMEAQLAGSEECAVFPYPIARNVIPCIGAPVAEGYTQEEMKLQNEGRKILHRPGLTVSCTCVRIPVVRCHSISVTARFLRPVDPEEARQAIEQAAGCRLVDDIALGNYPMPLTAGDQDLVEVGRIRRDLTDANGLSFWCCGDQLRKGAATNAVQIAELLS